MKSAGSPVPLLAPRARVQGLHREGNSRTCRGLGIGELQAWSILIPGVAYWANVVRTFQHHGPIDQLSIVTSIVSNGAFNLVAWAMLVTWAWTNPPNGSASRRQILVALLIGLLCVIPTSQTIAAALITLGMNEVLSRRGPHAWQSATLLFCIAAGIVWTSTYMLPLHNIVAVMDARICSLILGSFGEVVHAHGNLLENARASFCVEILANCSSSFPLCGIITAFVVTMLYVGRRPGTGDLTWLVMALLVSMLLTEARLTLMATSEQMYFWLHDGDGSTVYSLCALGLAVLFPLAAARRYRQGADCPA